MTLLIRILAGAALRFGLTRSHPGSHPGPRPRPNLLAMRILPALALFLAAGILAAGILTACAPAAPGQVIAPIRSAPAADSAATLAAYLVQTEIARPPRTNTPLPTLTPADTNTPRPTATPTLTPPDSPDAGATTAPSGGAATPSPTASAYKITPQPGLALYTNADLPDYVFQIDPDLWRKDPTGTTADLVSKRMPGCQIKAVGGHGLPVPEHVQWIDLGGFRWQVLDYGSWAYVSPERPGSAGGGGSAGGSFLQLLSYSVPACRAAQQQVLADLFTTAQARGEAALAPFRSPTLRPPLDGFSCPNTPPTRLRAGDFLSIVTDGLLLRSEPRADSATRLRQYLRYAPVFIRVTGGPVCEKYVYWQVSVSGIGEGNSQSVTGWFAEGDLKEYYLLPVGP